MPPGSLSDMNACVFLPSSWPMRTRPSPSTLQLGRLQCLPSQSMPGGAGGAQLTWYWVTQRHNGRREMSLCLLLVVSIARSKDGRREAEERVVSAVVLLNGEAGGGLNVVVTTEKNGISQ